MSQQLLIDLLSKQTEYNQQTKESIIVVNSYDESKESTACTVYLNALTMALVYKFEERYQEWKKYLPKLSKKYTERFTEIVPLFQPKNRKSYFLMAYDNVEEVWCVLHLTHKSFEPLIHLFAYFDSEVDVRRFAYQYTWINYHQFFDLVDKSDNLGRVADTYPEDMKDAKSFYDVEQSFREKFRDGLIEGTNEFDVEIMKIIEYYLQSSAFKFPGSFLDQFPFME